MKYFQCVTKKYQQLERWWFALRQMEVAPFDLQLKWLL